MAAEAWGTPPWAVVSAPGGALWLARLGTLRELQAFVQQRAGAVEEFEAL